MGPGGGKWPTPDGDLVPCRADCTKEGAQHNIYEGIMNGKKKYKGCGI